MPARDYYHDVVRNAIQKDGWTITHDPYHLISNHSKYAINQVCDRSSQTTTEAREVTGKLKIEISESIETLSNLLKPEKNLQKKERIQALYWIKSNLF